MLFVEISEHSKNKFKVTHFLSNAIRSDETWVYGYDMETKQQLSEWKYLVTTSKEYQRSATWICPRRPNCQSPVLTTSMSRHIEKWQNGDRMVHHDCMLIVPSFFNCSQPRTKTFSNPSLFKLLFVTSCFQS